MGQTELYEKLRVMLGTGPNEIATGNAIGLPKHEVIYTLLTNMFTGQEAEKTILPYEILKEHILNMKTDEFAVLPCPDRVAAKLAGRPCKRTDENFCVTAGPQVKGIVRQGLAGTLMSDLESTGREFLCNVSMARYCAEI